MAVWSAVVGKLLGGSVEIVANYFSKRDEIKSRERIRRLELEDALHQRKVDLIKEGLHADMNWEMEFAKQAASSWKDEYTLIVVSIPAVLAFIPGAAPIVHDGFVALNETPDWYQLMLITLFFATVGIRFWRRQQSDT